MKDYFLIVDTETTQNISYKTKHGDKIPSKVADFGMVLCDRKGDVIKTFACMVDGIYNNPEKYRLFFTSDKTDSVFGKHTLDKRYSAYDEMLKDGRRELKTVNSINSILLEWKAQYNPLLTAYNLPFDMEKCEKTNINLLMFEKRFCLWRLAVARICQTKKYKQFVLDNHYFTNRTTLGNKSYQTKAEIVYTFLTGDFTPEPHTSLLDALNYEKPILDYCIKQGCSKEFLLTGLKDYAYNWRDFQVKDHFKPIG
jgi:hypothetical protein